MNMISMKEFKPKETVKSADPLDPLRDVLFHETGVDGVYVRTGLYEGLVEQMAAMITRHREAGCEIMRFPPVSSRAMIEKSGYLKSFPNLLGCVCGLHGSEAEVLDAVNQWDKGNGSWSDKTTASDLVLAPAACYPVYPIAAKRGPLPKGGVTFDVLADCFRAEPSKHLDRFQSFRMREYVCVGTADDVAAFRDRWMEKAQGIATTMGLKFRVDTASDPFFGRVGAIKAVSQVQQALKFELLVPLRSDESPTACMSFNYHRDHFGTTWDIKDVNGEPAHTGCVAFGMDRLAVAMFHTHGTDTAKWPKKVREFLAM
ncbi:amino acid--[acyl-carrier-protein] ligase [Aestuariivirga litoralis]|uniref:amino acid--[acyl-carrier-protein] ligase n=1 Tax=Aestuariivirga litoralis TaxID=2650924 RepID=UPI0018C5700E|nr:amino acid--[acyl-carrier-protein] ligase [Aestuariivirga litoralis]MBG1233861.1 amino acid--[acyl-carrier-protein] ligase [Aestuariivirga litoralis]